jgi:hypothetical protein
MKCHHNNLEKRYAFCKMKNVTQHNPRGLGGGLYGKMSPNVTWGGRVSKKYYLKFAFVVFDKKMLL